MPEFDYRKHIMQSGLTIIGTGTLASAPVASVANQNMFYMSTDFGLCLSRRIVLLNGPDTLTFAPVASNLKDIDWSFSFGFRDGSATTDTYSRHVQFYAGETPNLIILASLTGGIFVSFRNNGVSSLYTIEMNALYNDLNCHRFTVGFRGGVAYAYSDIEPEKTMAVPAWNGTGFTSMVVSDQNASARPLAIFGIRQNTSVLVDCIQCDDALGTTVIANQCTPSRPATLSDSTAHAYSWVPQGLLQ